MKSVNRARRAEPPDAQAACMCRSCSLPSKLSARGGEGDSEPISKLSQGFLRKTLMHDIDRVRLETQSDFETPALKAEEFEYSQYEAPYSGEAGPIFGETENMELASQMLEIANEQELNQFIGDLISKAGSALGGFMKGPEGKALAGLLKGAARKVLPALGAAAGNFVGGANGADIGRRAAEAAGRAFGLELEGLSSEDREFEIARRYVNFAGEAVKNLVASPSAPIPARPPAPPLWPQPKPCAGIACGKPTEAEPASVPWPPPPQRPLDAPWQHDRFVRDLTPWQAAHTPIGCWTRRRARCWRGSLE